MNTLVEQLLSESSYEYNGHIRRVMEGKGQRIIADLEDDLADCQTRREVGRLIRDIEDKLDDCQFGEDERDSDDFANKAAFGTLAGNVIGSNISDGRGGDHAAIGTFAGLAAGMLAHHLSSKEESLIQKHINSLNTLLIQAKRKERSLKR
jgi:hypothetical protein